MNEQYQNGFCPQCGALLRDGVCPCCHFGASTGQNMSGQDLYGGSQSTMQNTAQNMYQNPYQDVEKDPYGYQPDNPYTNSYQNLYTQQNTKQKSSTSAAIIAAVIMVFVTIAAVVVVCVYASQEIDEYYTGNQDPDSYSDDWDYDWEEEEPYDDDPESYDYTEFTDDIQWDDKTWKEEPRNYPEYAVWDSDHKYYEDLKNCINENVPYTLSFETEEQLDKDLDVCMRVTYYQLEGDIPNLDSINQQLKETALEDVTFYQDEKEMFEQDFENYGEGYVVDAKTYVTYNDEFIISLVTYSTYESATVAGTYLNCMTIDLATGMVLDNTEILDVDDDFIKDVIKSSDRQNGSIDYVDNADIDDLKEAFGESDSLIVFYTPCGLEVGLNYVDAASYGWFTTSLTEYEEYLKSY